MLIQQRDSNLANIGARNLYHFQKEKFAKPFLPQCHAMKGM